MSEKETDHAATYIIMISIDHKKSINNFTKNGYRQANKPLENHRKYFVTKIDPDFDLSALSYKVL